MVTGWQPSRRAVLAGGFALSAARALPALAKAAPPPTTRVIVDNDFGGDPDGLFLLAHLMMCRTVAVPLVIGSLYKDFGAADLLPDKAGASAAKARELQHFFPGMAHPAIAAGSNQPLAAQSGTAISATSAAIIEEALRSDQTAPLVYAAGGSLTDIALAWQARPEIGKRLRLIWIGGGEHPDLASAPSGPGEAEYNFSLDRAAAQLVFNQSDIELWQVPRNAFRQMMIGLAELDELARVNRLGRYLRDQVVQAEQRLAANLPGFVFRAGETYTLGDTALVTLAALQSAFQPDTPSSSHVVRPRPFLADDGSYRANPAGRPMRIYSTIDAQLTWRDFTAKLRQR